MSCDKHTRIELANSNPGGRHLHRREFLKRGAAGAAGFFLSFGGSRAAGSDKPPEPPAQLPKRRLGKTGLMVSVVAYGGAPLWEHDPSNPVPEETVAKMVSRAMERGLNFLDVSHLYGRGYSEKAFGKALRGKRDKVVIFSRCPLGRDKSFAEMIDESLQRLATDYIDIYGMHGTWMTEDTADRFIEQSLPELEKAKKAGKIGHIAATGHQAPTAMVKMIQTGKIEVIEIPINPLWREFLEVALPAAKNMDVGVVGMKSLWRGRLLSYAPEMNALLGQSREQKLATDLGFCVSQDIASVSVGFVFEPEVDEDINAVVGFKGFSEEEVKRLALKGHETVKDNCRACNRCLPCPARIDVPRVLRLDLHAGHYNLKDWAKSEYRRLSVKADQCTKCGKCTERCPYGIPAQEVILRTAKELA